MSDERLGAKLRVTENRCVIFNPPTYVCIHIYITNKEALTVLYSVVKHAALPEIWVKMADARAH